MNADPADVTDTDVFDIGSLLSPHGDGNAIVDLAFGSVSQHPGSLDVTVVGRPLAMLQPETLELDLSDPAQRQFGDYELLEMIGEGGMGVVYSARQTSLDREVAIKLLAAGPWASHDYIERFRREAQNAARMQHPNIVAIYEVGSAEELHFFSMRLIRGASLASTLKDKGRFAPREAATLLRTVAEAVDYAHRLGVLHLDLKPANVLIDENGVPYVADFGLARRLDQGLAADNDEVSGTPSYMAPEQATAGVQKITPATDIWGLGAILYELVTGRPPFLGDSAQNTLKLVVQGQLPSPRRHNADLPRDLEAIILKCMAYKTTNRYTDARELADDLARFVEAREVLARRLSVAQRGWRWARREPKLAVTGLLALFALLGGLATTTQQWRRAQSNAQRAATQRQLAEHNADVSNRRLWESRRQAALREMSDGKGYAALPALIDNIRELEEHGRSAVLERREVSAVMNQGVVLVGGANLASADSKPFASALSNDGNLLAIAFTDLTVHWYRTEDLSELGKVDLLGLPVSTERPEMPILLRFVDNHRLRVTLDWPDYKPSPANNDTYLIDLDKGHTIGFPAGFRNPMSATFSTDGKFALLLNRQRQMQLWQVEPWQVVPQKRGGTTPVFIRGYQSNAMLLGPDARSVAMVGSNFRMLAVYDPRKLKSPTRINLPPTPGLSAMAEDRNGSKLALGDYAGRVLIVDMNTYKVRPLPTPPGREIRWIAFSEDGEWLAAARADGAAYAFDVATGNPLMSGQIQLDFELHRIAINHRQRLLIASSYDKTALWRLPQPGPVVAAATRVIASPFSSEIGGPYSVGFAEKTGMLATVSMSGEVRLWRIPASPVRDAHAAQQLPGSLHFDGRRVVDVAYDRLRIISVKGKPLTHWVRLPQPVDFAELADAGRTVVATAGRELRIYDAADMKLRHAPLKLPENPLRLDVSRDASAVVLSFAHVDDTGFSEQIFSYDLRTLRPLAGPVAVRGPLRQLEFSPSGRRILATGPPNGATNVFRAPTLKRVGRFKNHSDAKVIWAAFGDPSGAHAGKIALVTRAVAASAAASQLLIGNPATSKIEQRRSLGDIWPIGVVMTSTKPFVGGKTRDVIDPGGPDERGMEHPVNSSSTSAMAVSHDHSLIAHALGREVQLYDASSGTPIGAPLYADVNAMDLVALLAFAPDDDSLLGLTLQGQWLLWPTAVDQRAVASLRRQSDVLNNIASAKTRSAADHSTSGMAADPGPWTASPQRPSPPAARVVAGVPVPRRAPATDANMLDLTRYYDRAPGSLANPMINMIRVMRVVPTGIVHLDGVDYDVRGSVWLHDFTSAADLGPDQHTSIDGIGVPPRPITAFHILLSNQTPLQLNARRYATVHVHYRDGSREDLPLLTEGRHGGTDNTDSRSGAVWVWGDQNRLTGYEHQVFVRSPRIANPHPRRLVASIDIEATQTAPWLAGLVFDTTVFAITIEPVIPAGNSGTSKHQGSVRHDVPRERRRSTQPGSQP